MNGLDYDKIAERSCANCHVRGAFSFMLHEAPGVELRMFVTDPSHELWKNYADSESFSCGFHNHRMNTALIGCEGEVWNVVAFPNLSTRYPKALHGYVWDPVLLGGSGSFTRETVEPVPHGVASQRLPEWADPQRRLRTIVLKPEALHTIYVPKGRRAAWFVWSHGDNPAHDTRCWTNVDLTTWQGADFYQPVTARDVERRLAPIADRVRAMVVALT